MITLVHGGQRGVDRGAHEAAISNGWYVTGYMPHDGRDELGQIPPDVARWLRPHETRGYAARTEANVRASNALLIVVQDRSNPRATPGTAKTIDLAESRGMPQLIVDPTDDAGVIARWILALHVNGTLPLPLGTATIEPPSTRLLVAGPRESRWPGARVETAGLLRRVGRHVRFAE